MRDKDCIFCKIINREIPSKIIFENDLNLAFLDIFPISRGHTIVVPKNHYNNLENIPVDKLSELFKSVKEIATKIHKKLKIDGYNILQNNYKAAGQDINHIHVHIIPRKLDEKRLRFEIPRNQASEDDLNSVLDILKS